MRAVLAINAAPIVQKPATNFGRNEKVSLTMHRIIDDQAIEQGRLADLPMTKQATKAQVLAYAKRLYPGQDIHVDYNPKAVVGAARQELRDRRDALRVRKPVVEQEIKQLSSAYPRLRDAARFVVDVRGDDPSIDQLSAALESADRLESLLDENRSIYDELRALSSKIIWQRCKVVRGIEIVAWCDTWQKCLDQLRRK